MTVQLLTPTGTPFSFRIVGTQIHVRTSGNTLIRFRRRAINDLFEMLRNHGGWMRLGTKGEEEDPVENSVEAWARSENNPIGGFYGLTNGRRGRFATYMPSILEHLGLARVTHHPKNNMIRAL